MWLHVLENGLHVQQIALLVPERPLTLETRKLICYFSLVLPNRNTNLLNRTLNLRIEASNLFKKTPNLSMNDRSP